METNRLMLRDRTRLLITEMLNQSKEDQLKFFGFDTVDELEEKIIRIKKAFENPKVDYRIFDFIEKESKKVIGSAGFHNWIKDHDRAEVGYSLHEPFRGKGFMQEGMQPIIHLGFEAMNLNRMEALISPSNLASINLIKRCGFSQEGVLRGHYKEGDNYDNSLLFSLLKSDFTEIEKKMIAVY